MTDKHNIPKGKMHSNYRLLHEDIVCKITQRNTIRRTNTYDPVLKLLNEEITADIQKHMEGASKRSLGPLPQHKHFMEDHTWSIQYSTSNHIQQLHHIQQQNNKQTQTYCELFHQTIHKHATHRSIDRATQNIQGYNITLTTSQVQEAIKQS